MGVLSVDTFTEPGGAWPLTGHTPDTGTGWTEEEATGVGAEWHIQGFPDTLTCNATEDDDRCLNSCQPTPTEADVDVDVEIVTRRYGADHAIGVFARLADTNNYYSAGVYGYGSPNDQEINKKVGGSVTELAASGNVDIQNGEVLTFELRGTGLRLLIDGGEELSTTDSDISAAGEAGVAIGNFWTSTDDADAGWELDNWQLEEFGAAGYTLECDSGSFAWTGTAASLLYSGAGYTLTAESGSFVLTGTAVSLEYGRAFSASAGSFTLDGTAADLRATHLLGAASAAYGLTGVAASLEYGRVLSAGGAAYALTGSTLDLLVGRLVQAVAGSFAWTGTNATLDYSAGWSPIWTLEDKYKTALMASEHAALLGLSKTKTEIISTGELVTLEAALIHFWPFDSDYVDARGGITFVPQIGTPPFVAGKYGNAVEVEQGVSDQLLATDTIDQPTGSFSVAGWGYRITATGSACHYLLAGPWRSTPPYGWAWFLQMSSNEGCHFQVSGASGVFSAVGPAHLLQDTWSFFCGVWDDDIPEMTLYHGISGGALESTAGASSGYVGPRRSDVDQVRGPFLTVGKSRLDHLKVWNEALSPALVEAEYEDGLAA